MGLPVVFVFSFDDSGMHDTKKNNALTIFQMKLRKAALQLGLSACGYIQCISTLRYTIK